MIRTNGFALYRGHDAPGWAEKGLARVDRFSRSRLASSDGEQLKPIRTGTAGSEIVVALSLDEDAGDPPLVHGFVSQRSEGTGEPRSGEFAFLARRGDGFVAGRDALGTRPLYADRDGSIVASDHRFFPPGREPRLLPRGTTMDAEFRVRQTRAVESAQGGSIHEAASRLADLLEESVKRRVSGHRKLAVSFSGGLDSSIIAALAARHAEVTLCSAYAVSSRDERTVERAAELLGLRLVRARMDRSLVANELSRLDLPFIPTQMDKALWCLYSTTARLAASEGAEVIMLGQLADELFGGYMKYALAAERDETVAASMMEADVIASAERAFVRDEEACARFLEPRFPFADETVVSLGQGLPLSYKILGRERKRVLRMAASVIGLPDEISHAPKKAAQFSSGVIKLLR